jgi:hypothetical protein
MSGHYVFGDFSGPNLFTATGRLMYLDLGTSIISEFAMTASLEDYITGFGQDVDNELYLITNNTFSPLDITGKLLKIEALGGTSTPPDGTGEMAMCPPSEDLCIAVKSANAKIVSFCL